MPGQCKSLNEEYRGDERNPQALHKVRAPSGPRRHSGVSARLQLWHRPGGAALYGKSAWADGRAAKRHTPRRFLGSDPANPPAPSNLS